MNNNKKRTPITFVSLDELIERENEFENENDEYVYGYPDEVELDFNDDITTHYDPEVHE